MNAIDPKGSIISLLKVHLDIFGPGSKSSDRIRHAIALLRKIRNFLLTPLVLTPSPFASTSRVPGTIQQNFRQRGKMPLFELGKIGATEKAIDNLDIRDTMRALNRHAQGDWGEATLEDKLENDLAIEHGFQIRSIFTDSEGVRFKIETTPDRASTTISLYEDV